MEMQTRKHLFYQDSNFIVEIEFIGRVVVLHCSVLNWKLSVMKKTYEVFSELKQLASSSGCTHLVTAPIHPKFAKLFGGSQIGTISVDDKNYEVIVWEL
jgi:hypothetical protein